MLKFGEKHYRHAAWALLLCVLFLILLTFRDYGVTWDEELQSQYGQAVADYYISGFKDLRYAEIFNLYLYGGMFDGLAALVDRQTPFSLYETRHLLNALFGLIGLWGVWRIGRHMGGGLVGFIALILCATVPMYYGHMFNNPKDIPFAAGIIWCLYFMFRSMTKPSPTILIKLGVTLGLTLGVRIGGVMIIPFWVAPMGFVGLLPLLEKRDQQTIRLVAVDLLRRGIRVVLPVMVIAYGVMLICWPWAQQHPFLNPLRALSEFSNFPQDVEVLLNGTTYRSTELPWFYVPLYFGVQLPEILLFLLAVALAVMPRIWRDLTLTQRQCFALMSLMGLFPILYAVIRHPALYDTVRHFLFAVPIMCVVAALGARTAGLWILEQFKNARLHLFMIAGLTVVFAVGIALQIAVMAQLHPYEYIFANRLVGGVAGAFGRYETEYWGSSFKKAAEELQTLVAAQGGVPDGHIYKIAICGPWASAMIYLPPDYQAVVANEPAEFFLSTTRWQCQNMRPGKEVIRVERMGVPLAIIKDLRGGYEHYPGNSPEK